MALLNVNFMSQSLGMGCSATVILPQYGQKPYKTLYLLHGLSDDHTAWTRYTSIERYANDYGIAVVMPNVHRSFYTDIGINRGYFEFVSEELISIMEDMFPLSDKREDRYTAGLSMGGYGAMKLGLSCPEKFSVAASLSGALDVIYRMYTKEDIKEEFKFIWNASEEERNKNDLFYLAEKLNVSGQPKPRLYIWCGTEDFLYQDNVNFKNFINKLDFEVTYEETAGDHLWYYWDLNIQKVLKFIFNR